MGYSFDQSGRLCCDACGQSGNVRKRTCPHKVIYPGETYRLDYCQPSALCPACYATRKATLHERCKEGAAARNAQLSAEWDRLQSGDPRVRSAFGSWHALVPTGYVGVVFETKDRTEAYYLIEADEYAQRSPSPFLSDFKQSHPWTGPHPEAE